MLKGKKGQHMKVRRHKHLFYEFNGDGRYPKDRIKGCMKRYIKKWFLREEKKQAFKDNIFLDK